MLVIGIVIIMVGVIGGTIGLSVLIRAHKGGAFDNAEDVKYVVFREDDDFEYDEPPQ